MEREREYEGMMEKKVENPSKHSPRKNILIEEPYCKPTQVGECGMH